MRIFPVLLLLCPALAWAETATAAPSPSGSIVQMLLSLFLVLAMIIGGLWILKRLTGHRGNASNLLRVVGGTSLGTRERIVIVEMGETWLVLGVTPSSINTLAEMPRQAMPPAAPQAIPGWMQKMLDKKNARKAA